MIDNLFLEEETADDLHIYIDDLTGDYYYFDGEKLVKEGLDDAQRELEILMRR